MYRYKRMGGVSIISGTSDEVCREPFPTSLVSVSLYHEISHLSIESDAESSKLLDNFPQIRYNKPINKFPKGTPPP